MQLTLRHDLGFVTATLTYRGATVRVPDLLVDTGAASTVLNADLAADAGVFLEPSDRLRTLRGVGGREYVFVRHVDRLAIGEYGLDDFDVEIGEWRSLKSRSPRTSPDPAAGDQWPARCDGAALALSPLAAVACSSWGDHARVLA